MYNCLVVVPHYTKFDNITFVKTCVNQINKHIHPETNVTICVVDQCEEYIKSKVHNALKDIPNVKIIDGQAIDAGYPLDLAIEYFKNENFDYFCSLDADAFVISNLFLYLPILLIEKFGYSYVGSSTDLVHWGYYEQAKDFYDEWLHINNYYRVSKFSTALKCSEDVGFIRISNRQKVNKTYVETPFEKNIEWADNGVIAQWYSDYINQGDKLSLEIITRAGLGKDGIFGMNIENLVFHVVFGYREIDVGTEEGYVNSTDEKIRKFIGLLKEEDLIEEEKILEVIRNSEPEKNGRWINFETLPPEEVINFIDSFVK